VLFGGFFTDPMCPGGCPRSRDDVWTWNGTRWQEEFVAAPTERTHHASSYDVDRGCLVMFGGGSSAMNASSPAETWELCGDHWTSISGRQPTARVSGAMAYDSIRRRTVLFGGRNISGAAIADTSVWDGTTWTEVTGVGPSARTGHALAFDPVRGAVLMFGGQSSTTYLNDTWEWNGTRWTQLAPATQPPPRSDHSMTFDPIRQRLLLLGGDNGMGSLADHWEWDGATWTQLPGALLPPARASYGVAWNAPRKRVVQFGGAAQFTYFDDVWESTGPAWSQQFASGGPMPRTGHSLTPMSSGVLMFAGYNGSFATKDLWRLRWDDDKVNEACTLDADTDEDGLAGCADPDCWGVCTPLCPPGAPCAASAPRCGDGACNSAIETCRMCPGDCGPCAAVCGDNFCDGSETAASCRGDCP